MPLPSLEWVNQDSVYLRQQRAGFAWLRFAPPLEGAGLLGGLVAVCLAGFYQHAGGLSVVEPAHSTVDIAAVIECLVGHLSAGLT